MPFRISYIFSVTTNPTQLQDAVAHSGGWSEGFWYNDPVDSNAPGFHRTAQRRAALLPTFCAITGWRIQTYTIFKNRLLPGGAATVKALYPGSYSTMNLPQDGLQLSFTMVGNINTTRMVLRGIPDNQISRGEYQPDETFRTALKNFTDYLIGGNNPYGAVIKDKTGGTARVQSVNVEGANFIRLNANIAAAEDYLRLLRVKDSVTGKPISGSFLITAKPSSTGYTMDALPAGVVSRNSGLAQKDQLVFAAYASCRPARALPRKIGGPSEKYRGRRSKRRT